jgi:6,7-dimethyl-8-ribityllumazine synthase
MSGAGAPTVQVDGTGLRIAVIAGRWHEVITNGLIAGAHETIVASGADHTLFRVSGAFELPVVAKAALNNGFDAAVCLAVIIRGGTPHFEYVSSAATDGLTQVAINTGKPIGFGVLTIDTEAQGLDRAGLAGSTESKGEEAALAALEAAVLLRVIHAEDETTQRVSGKRS